MIRDDTSDIDSNVRHFQRSSIFPRLPFPHLSMCSYKITFTFTHVCMYIATDDMCTRVSISLAIVPVSISRSVLFPILDRDDGIDHALCITRVCPLDFVGRRHSRTMVG